MIKIRIGAFSKKHKVTQSTVRHYLDIGLLTTKKLGGQYFFHEKDSRDMEEIIKLKQLGFSLNEILKLLKYLRLTGIKTEEYNKLLVSMLEQKKIEIDKVWRKYEEINSKINETIETLQNTSKKESKIIGFPIAYLGILTCPECKSKLNINKGTINNSMLIEGSAICPCGYQAKIDYGILIEEKTVGKRDLNGNPWPSRDEYLKVVSSNYINFINSGMNKITEKLKDYDRGSKLILELQHCVGYFLRYYIEYKSMDSTYILVDYDINKIIELKKDLELNREDVNFIFLCCNIDRIPLKDSSIDIVIDHWKTKDYALTNKDFVLKKVLHLLKSDGILGGVYPYFKNMKNIENIHEYALDYYKREKLIDKIENLGIVKESITDTDSIIESNPYNYDISGKEVYQMIYLGKVKT